MPEEVGSRAAKQLFEEVSRGGAVDSTHQVHCRQLMAPTPDRRATALHLTGCPSSDAVICDRVTARGGAAAVWEVMMLNAMQQLEGNAPPTDALAVCLHHRA